MSLNLADCVAFVDRQYRLVHLAVPNADGVNVLIGCSCHDGSPKLDGFPGGHAVTTNKVKKGAKSLSSPKHLNHLASYAFV